MSGTTREPFECRLVARNDEPNAANPIHRNDYARSLGYPGGLVPGATLYAYAADAAVRALGERWLEHGYGEVHFRRPVFDSEELTIRAEPADGGDWRITLTSGELRAEAVAGPYRHAIQVDDLQRDDEAPAQLPANEPLVAGTPLKRPLEWQYGRGELEAYIAAAGLEGTVLASALRSRGLLPPNVISGVPFWVLWRTLPCEMIIHTSSVTESVGPARLGQTFCMWGIIDDAFEKRGRPYATQRLVTVDGEGNLVARVLYTSAYEPKT